jgi:hypothetical protein
MLAVIFGAGASYDAFPTFPIDGRSMGHARLPLAGQLFDDRPEFEAARERFRDCLALIPYLQNRPDGQSVEQVLEQFELIASTDNGKRGARTRQQLTAFKFYLQLIISSCEHSAIGMAHGVTNHLTLLDLIEKNRRKDDTVCLITFNYDCLIERALAEAIPFSITAPGEYVSRPYYKLFKLHGSINWGHEVMEAPGGLFKERNDRETK